MHVFVVLKCAHMHDGIHAFMHEGKHVAIIEHDIQSTDAT